MLFESSFEDPEAHNNKLLALVESIAKMNGQRAGAPVRQLHLISYRWQSLALSIGVLIRLLSMCACCGVWLACGNSV